MYLMELYEGFSNYFLPEFPNVFGVPGSENWAQKPFCVPHFLFVGNRLHSASLTFPEFQREGSNSCLSGKGGDAETRAEQSRNNSASLGKGS